MTDWTDNLEEVKCPSLIQPPPADAVRVYHHTNKENGEYMKVAIITGGNRGIGKSAALNLASRGVGVILTYNSHSDDRSHKHRYQRYNTTGYQVRVHAVSHSVTNNTAACRLSVPFAERFIIAALAPAQALKRCRARATRRPLVVE